MATHPAPAPQPAVTMPTEKTPRLTSKQLGVLELLSDGRVRKATTRTNPSTDEVNGTTAASMVPYGYVEGQAVPGHTMYKITGKGLEFLRSFKDKQQMLQAKRDEAKPAETANAPAGQAGAK